MQVGDIKQALAAAKASHPDGKVSTQDIDRLMLRARDEGGLDATERQALLKASDGFDDAVKQRLLVHLASLSQKNGWVNVEAAGQVTTIEGRYANLSVGIKGLTARVGMFDNTFVLQGAAKAKGTVSVVVEGQPVQVPVNKGDTASEVLERVRAALPASVTGVVLGGDVAQGEAPGFTGKAATRADSAAHLMLYKPEALALRADEVPLRVVVTGYGQFMGITKNPSGIIAQKLAEIGVKGGVVEYHRLDVTPNAVNDFMKAMKNNPPDVILSMGVTGGQSQLEELPENQLGAAPDGNDVMMTAGPIIPGGPQEVPTDFPVETVEWALKHFGKKRQTFTSISDPHYQPDRSEYLCNYIGYQLAQEFGDTPDTTAGFIHVTDKTPVNQMHAVLEAVVAKQLDYRRTKANPVGPTS